jgi:DNA-directed RNA polymerase specialized sigma24 family protein
MSESEWVALVRAVAAHDQTALYKICSRTSSIVFTLLFRITGSLRISEELIVDVFEDLWLRSRTYDPAHGPVTRWIMNQARFRAIERMRFEQIRQRLCNGQSSPETTSEIPRGHMLLHPSAGLWLLLSQRISGASAIEAPPAHHPSASWMQVAPGISVELVSVDESTSHVSMLVRLDPGTDYPSHRHAGVEELHLLHGELMIDDKKLQAGDFSRAEPGSIDHRVWSDMGCTCFLMTSAHDTVL